MMSAMPSRAELRRRFHDALNAALTAGTAPTAESRLGERTIKALTLLASAHPDATPKHIAHAYDQFDYERRD